MIFHNKWPFYAVIGSGYLKWLIMFSCYLSIISFEVVWPTTFNQSTTKAWWFQLRPMSATRSADASKTSSNCKARKIMWVMQFCTPSVHMFKVSQGIPRYVGMCRRRILAMWTTCHLGCLTLTQAPSKIHVRSVHWTLAPRGTSWDWWHQITSRLSNVGIIIIRWFLVVSYSFIIGDNHGCLLDGCWLLVIHYHQPSAASINHN